MVKNTNSLFKSTKYFIKSTRIQKYKYPLQITRTFFESTTLRFKSTIYTLQKYKTLVQNTDKNGLKSFFSKKKRFKPFSHFWLKNISSTNYTFKVFQINSYRCLSLISKFVFFRFFLLSLPTYFSKSSYNWGYDFSKTFTI